MESHDRIVTLIPDYVVDALPAADCEAVRRHVEQCAACRELVQTAIELRETLPAGLERLLDHPHAALIDAFAAGEASGLEPSTADWVRSHVSSCDTCRETVDRLRAPQQQAAREPPKSRRPRHLGAWIAGVLLQPALAAAYLLLLALALPFAVRGLLPRPVPAPVGAGVRLIAPPAMLFGQELFRGGESEAVAPVAVRLPDSGPLRLRLVAGLAPEDWEPGRRVVLELRDPAGTVETRELAPADPDDGGSLLLELPRERLDAPGDWTVVVGGAPPTGAIDTPIYRSSFHLETP